MASTSTESSSNLLSQLFCTKCKELFNAPKILPCGHLMCRHCLLAHVQSQQASAECLVCQSRIRNDGDSQPQPSADELVESFPTDLTMAKLVQVHRLISEAHVCHMCKPRDVTAESICLTCGDVFCGSCKGRHMNQTFAKNHIMEDLKTLTVVQLAARRPTTCPEHEEVCKLYCCPHGALICGSCASSTHRQCQNVVSLQDGQKKASEELEQLTTLLSKGESLLNKRVENLDRHITNQSTRLALGKINSMKRRLVSVIDKRCKDLKEEVNNAASEARHQKNELLRRKAQLSQHRTIISRGKPYPSLAALDPKLASRLRQIHRSATTLSNELKSFNFTVDLKETKRAISRVGTLTTVSVPHTSLERLERAQSAAAFEFHTRHGSNITLSPTATTAIRSDNIQQREGVVLSRLPMQESMLYEVKIIKQKKRLFALGVMTTDPETHALPARLDQLDPFVLCLSSDGFVYAFGSPNQKKDDRLKVMQHVDSSRLGLALDQSRNLHLLWNGQDQGVVASNIPQPAYFAMDLLTPNAKITAMALRPFPASLQPQAGHSTQSEDFVR